MVSYDLLADCSIDDSESLIDNFRGCVLRCQNSRLSDVELVSELVGQLHHFLIHE